jgi:excisionase family DNA binding protein
MKPVEPQTELSIQLAAERLGVSLEFVKQLIADGSFRSVTTGGELRISDDALTEFRRQIDERRCAVLDELADQAQELDMGY